MKTKTILTLLTLSIGHFVCAQSVAAASGTSSGGWSKNDIFQNKVFIENKGQFDGKDNLPASAILFGIVSDGQQIYFSSKGLTFRYDVREYPKTLLAEIKREQAEGKKEKPGEFERALEEQAKATVHAIHMEWLNVNPDAEIISEEIVPQYYTYGDEKIFYKASAYKKITYKNLYPNIDVEYIFHKKEGIKYSLTLHPGADPSNIKMKYSGMDKVYKDEIGNIHLVTPLGDIVDHAPYTFYSHKGVDESNSPEIPSAFSVNNNIVSFVLNTASLKQVTTDKHQPTIVIDPWTVGVTLPTSNKALEMERDFAGNIYIFGGTNGTTSGLMVMRKYSSAGAFLWQYTPVVVSNCGGKFTGEYGNDLKIDKANDIYIVAGGGCGIMYKLNAAGTVLWSTGNLTTEPYRLGMDCGGNSLYVISGQSSWSNANGIYSTSTGLLSITTPPLFTSVGADDLRDFVRGPDGNYYGMSSAQTGPGRLLAFNPAFINMWAVNHAYPITYWSGGYSGHVASQPLSIHTIAVSKNFIYTTSGAVLNKRNLATGAIIGATVTIPGGVIASNANGNSGIILDTCNNVYVSSQNGVYKYDANLNFISFAATTAAVYDICLGSNPGEILACGNGFLASLDMSACVPAPLNVTAIATPTGNCNNGNTGTATATTTGGKPNYSYYWMPGGQTTSSISGLGAGTYSIIVTDEDCNKDTAVVTVTSAAGALQTSIYKTDLLCNGGSNGSASVGASSGTPPYTYLWSMGSTSATVSGLSANTYTVIVTDNNGCKVIRSLNISQPPLWAMEATNITSTTCNNPNGRAEVSVAGNSGPYTYLWSTGSTYRWAGGQSNAWISNKLAGGTYTVTVTDAKGCTQTTTATVPSSVSTVNPDFTQSPSTSVCIGTTVNFTNTGTPPGTGVTHNWLISTITPANVSGTTTDFSYTFLTVGTYTVSHTVNDGTCNNTKTSTVTVINCAAGPTVTATGSSICSGKCGSVTASGAGGTSPYTYSWSTGETLQNISSCPTTTTTYTVKVTDNTGATATSTTTVTVNPAVTVSTTVGVINCSGGKSSVTATGTSGTSPYTFNWSTGATTTGTSSTIPNLPANTYSVTVTDANGCTTTTTVLLTAPPPLLGQFTKGTAPCSNCGCQEWVMVNAVNGTPPYTYQWPDSYDKRYKNKICPGNYTVKVTDKNGCSVDVLVTAP